MTQLKHLIQLFIIGLALGIVVYGIFDSLLDLVLLLAVCGGFYLIYREQFNQAVLTVIQGGESHD